jgi:hypothetical protein
MSGSATKPLVRGLAVVLAAARRLVRHEPLDGASGDLGHVSTCPVAERDLTHRLDGHLCVDLPDVGERCPMTPIVPNSAGQTCPAPRGQACWR